MLLLLLPVLVVGQIICHVYLYKRYNQLIKDIEQENYDDLDTMHHLSSGMKSVITQTTMDALGKIRLSLGEAGFTAWSGIPYLIKDYSAVPTFEGDNTVMAQQSAGYLLKLFKR